jgi:hypothetical protein
MLIESRPELTPADYAAEAAAFVPPLAENAPRRVWVAYHPERPPGPFTRPAVDQGLSERGYFHCATVVEQPALRLDLYTPRQLSAAALTFGENALRLEAVGELQARAGSLSMALLTAWGDAGPSPLAIGLHLDDPAGNLAAQSDFPMPPEPTGCAYTQLDLAGLPAGEYRLYALVYDPASGDRLPGLNPAEDDSADRLLIAIIHL